MRVLVAEDDVDENNLYRVALRAKGHIVTTTRNGKECVRVYKEEMAKTDLYEVPFDAVVLDYAMPEMDGLEAAKDILALKKDQRLIIVTAYVRETLKASVQELRQVVSIIEKPFVPDLLTKVVEDASTLRELAEISKMPTVRGNNTHTDVQITQLHAVLKRRQKIGLT
ncbi:response regulator [Nitrososphaera sp.]|uniref:response regulator n=1 Tax=Nitrososphaera sp. TaxID=1971748 RepID=UPI002ED7D225